MRGIYSKVVHSYYQKTGTAAVGGRNRNRNQHFAAIAASRAFAQRKIVRIESKMQPLLLLELVQIAAISHS